MRIRPLVLVVAMSISGVLTTGALSAQAAGGDITTACSGVVSGHTFTLTADCDTTATLTVPDGFTVDGAGHEITAHDPDPAAGLSGLFLGAVVGNAGATMNLTDLTVRRTGFISLSCNASATPTVGVLYNNASGTMRGVQVLDITQHSTCQTVHAIQLRSDAGPQTVSITGSTAAIYQRTALLVQGDVTVQASGDTFGPPDPRTPNPGGLAQNTVQIGSPALPAPSSATITDSKIIGSGFGRSTAASTAVLLAGAANVNISHNSFAGVGTDVGVSFFGRNTDVTIAYNDIARSAQTRPGFEDPYGIGVDVTDESRPTTKLICNTFSGWNQNLANAVQAPCITTAATVPCVTVEEPVDLHLAAFVAADESSLVARLVDGELPPGLTLHQDGTITGTPTRVGNTTATVEFDDPEQGSASRAFTFCVQAAGPSPSPTSPATTHPSSTSHPATGGPSHSSSRPPTSLANTGVRTGLWSGVALALLCPGGLILARSRRKLVAAAKRQH